MTADDTLAIELALRFACRRCRCRGSRKRITWNMDGGSPYERCPDCVPYRIALTKLLRLSRVRVAA